jgi:hypothetical protein
MSYLFLGCCCTLTCPIQAPNIPCTKSHVSFSLCRLYHCISPGPRLTVWMFCSKIRFYGEDLLTPCPIPKLDDHFLSAVLDCLFNIFAATLQIVGSSSIRNLRTRHAVVTGTHLSRDRDKIQHWIMKYLPCQKQSQGQSLKRHSTALQAVWWW